MAKINRKKNTKEYDYNNNKLDVEQDYRQQRQEELEREEGKFSEDLDKEREGDDYTGAGNGGKGEIMGREEEEGYSVGETQFYFDDLGEDTSDDDAGVQSNSEEEEDKSEEDGKRKKGKESKKVVEEKETVYVPRKKGGKIFYVKKRNPIKMVDIEKMLKTNWWVEAQTSIGKMARRCYALSTEREKVVRKVNESFLLFLTTGLKASHHQFSSPLTYWSDVRHDPECHTHHPLAKLALCMINTLASEAPCERVFSKMKILIGDHRCNLSARTVFHMFVIAGI
jgi:hypothetical protein